MKDIKHVSLNIKPGITAEKVLSELEFLEAQVAAGNVKAPPTATIFLPDNIQEIINKVTI
jgi:hypothetical protein